MSYPARPLLWTWFSGFLAAATAFITVCGCVAQANERCTTEPNFKAAQAGHWYYRVDRVSQRKCWFLARPGVKVTPPAPAKAQSAAKPRSLTADAPKASEITGNSRRGIDQATVAAQDIEAPQPGVGASVAIDQPQAEPQPATLDEAPMSWPVLAASEPEPSGSPAGFPVAPVHLIAVLSAALGLAAVAARLIFNYSVLYSA